MSETMKKPWKASYKGFVQKIVRTFATKREAVQWVRQVGKEREAIITKAN